MDAAIMTRPRMDAAIFLNFDFIAFFCVAVHIIDVKVQTQKCIYTLCR